MRWFFLNSELNNPSECKETDEFVVYLNDYEIGVIVYRNGEVSNQWADGTVGVPMEVREEADYANELHNPDNLDEQGEWRDVIANEEGEFIGWA